MGNETREVGMLDAMRDNEIARLKQLLILEGAAARADRDELLQDLNVVCAERDLWRARAEESENKLELLESMLHGAIEAFEGTRPRKVDYRLPSGEVVTLPVGGPDDPVKVAADVMPWTVEGGDVVLAVRVRR